MTDGLGMIVRSDNGGLGALTWEAWRHLRPARTLIVYSEHRTRGRAHVERYNHGGGEVRSTPVAPTRDDWRWLLTGLDTLYSAETWYSTQLPLYARRARVRTVLHVMPEYYTGAPANLLLAPTSWRMPPRSELLRVPVARDRLPRRTIGAVDTLYHIESPEADRNGTRLLYAACEHMTQRCRLLVRGHSNPGHSTIGRVHVKWLGHHDGPYYESWPEDVDALVMPRRFAGLSLPMQEAASLGLPVVTLDRAPEREWFTARVPVTATTQVRIWQNNMVESCDADPRALAASLDTLVRADPSDIALLTKESDDLADELDWARWLPEYQRVLS